MSHTRAPSPGRACPFCGIVTDAPHETQEACIEALHAEIARLRELLDTPTLTHLSLPPPPPPKSDR